VSEPNFLFADFWEDPTKNFFWENPTKYADRIIEAAEICCLKI
jgi:hypothetical protein